MNLQLDLMLKQFNSISKTLQFMMLEDKYNLDVYGTNILKVQKQLFTLLIQAIFKGLKLIDKVFNI